MTDGSGREWAEHHYYYRLGAVFTAPEAEAIVRLATALPARSGEILSHDGRQVRDSTLFWLGREPATQWIFERLDGRVAAWNASFEFELDRAGPRHCQISCYKVGQRYGWHMDLGRGPSSRRKVSLVIGLNTRADYGGGGVEFFYGNRENPVAQLEVGEGVLFPAYTMHRAVEVTEGERWTLVAWFCGNAPFR